ncbi:uncharacterized protein EV154DRAFT_560727 [Mucor mucedo]|uniref:uncharacterized protein n=1 Tax=Mucor mucedo TaxID=29922 RepID=UPI00221F1902|nr:uncharacterized protein EV154DRAFT_560727 [Mucor mucedo]KAI7893962.1 hypothetical protein EV154DRAFT_560727 [Mucor mucedo]
MTVLDHESLPSNEFYQDYFPTIILCLCTVYILSYFIRYGLHQFRRYRDRKKQQEKKHLIQHWQRRHLQQHTTAVAFPPFTYTTTSSCTLNSSTLPTSGHHSKLPQQQKAWSKPKNKYQWISKDQRLNLLWHWSVSMGHVEYDHAKGLNALVQQLSIVRLTKTSSFAVGGAGHTPLEKVIVEA